MLPADLCRQDIWTHTGTQKICNGQTQRGSKAGERQGRAEGQSRAVSELSWCLQGHPGPHGEQGSFSQIWPSHSAAQPCAEHQQEFCVSYPKLNISRGQGNAAPRAAILPGLLRNFMQGSKRHSHDVAFLTLGIFCKKFPKSPAAAASGSLGVELPASPGSSFSFCLEL